MNRDECIFATALFVVVVAVAVAVLPTQAGDSCCSDRAVMTKGIQAAHSALRKNDPVGARTILEDTAEATGVPL